MTILVLVQKNFKYQHILFLYPISLFMRIKRTFVKNRMMEKVEDVLANTTCNLNKKLALTKKSTIF